MQESRANAQMQQELCELYEEQEETPRKLRALWGLSVTDALSSRDLQEMLTHQDEYIRGWAIQLLMDMGTPSEEILAQFAETAASDRSALVQIGRAHV